MVNKANKNLPEILVGEAGRKRKQYMETDRTSIMEYQKIQQIKKTEDRMIISYWYYQNQRCTNEKMKRINAFGQQVKR